MAREFFRPYNKIIDVADLEQHNILLTDTSGGLLACNYVAVTSVSGGDTGGIFQIVPSGIDTMYGRTGTLAGSGSLSSRDVGPSAYNNADERVTNSASGVLGLVGNSASETLILSLSPMDTTNALILTQHPATATRYAITYGHVALANQMADNRWNAG
jgi:hypothetical protein